MTDDTEWTHALAGLGRGDQARAGGKAANLGPLLHAGLPVPQGFVVLTAAYQRFLDANGLHAEIERHLAPGPVDAAGAERAAAALRAAFATGYVPPAVADAIVREYRRLGGDAVAVRSSATAEDLNEASFAGQHESFLGVRGEAAVVAAVRTCWSSLFTPRAVQYRARHGIDSRAVQIAVLVQTMVPATVSGVLFTVDPVTGDRGRCVIEATWGLGEALVSGRVTPDTYTVDKASGQIARAVIGDKQVQVVGTSEGTTEQPVPDELRRRAALSPAQVASLLELGRKVEEHFGAPQDIEWALAEEGIRLLQARPVTAGGQIPQAQQAIEHVPVAPGDDGWNREGDRPAQPSDFWTRTNIGENLPFPVTPLTEAVMRELFQPRRDEPLQPGAASGMRRIYGRLYLNEGAMLQEIVEQWGIPASALAKIWGSKHAEQPRLQGGLRPLRLLRKLASMLLKRLRKRRTAVPRHTPAQFFAQVDAWVNDFLKQDLRSLDDQALWAAGLPVWRERAYYAFDHNLRISVQAAIAYALLERMVKKEVAHQLVISPTGVYSAEVGPALWRMVERLRAAHLEGALAAPDPDTLQRLRQEPGARSFLTELDAFLVRHGHRCPNELELLNPRWGEAPAQVLELVATYLKAARDPAEAEARQQRQMAAAISSVETSMGMLKRRLFRMVLSKAQRAITLRDNSRYYMAKFLLPLRMLFAHLGGRWAARGLLTAAEDIFFLTPEEIRVQATGGVDARPPLKERVAKRRQAYSYWLTVLAPDAVTADDRALRVDTAGKRELLGIAASGGKARGRARVINDVREALRLGAGDILVTRATDPGWTPIFPLVSGIVLETGGQLSHGAIVAREYAIPTVISVSGAMSAILDGQMITVDGTGGRVLLDEQAPT